MDFQLTYCKTSLYCLNLDCLVPNQMSEIKGKKSVVV